MATDEERQQLENLAMVYWHLNHETLVIEMEKKQELADTKEEMHEVEGKFKALRNKTQIPVSLEDFAYKSKEDREQSKVPEEEKMKLLCCIISDMSAEELISISGVLKAALKHYQDDIEYLYQVDIGSFVNDNEEEEEDENAGSDN
jgi:hypothetical protein